MFWVRQASDNLVEYDCRYYSEEAFSEMKTDMVVAERMVMVFFMMAVLVGLVCSDR